jgi:phosphatidylinositol alpha-mannosyltransferase
VARLGFSPRSFAQIKQIVRQEAFDIIHLHEPLAPGLNWQVLMQTRHLPRTALVGTFHAYHDQPHWFYRHGHPMLKPFFRRLDGLIAVSGAARRFAGQFFPADYQLIPNGINLPRFDRPGPAPPPNPSGPATILFVGRLDPRKGFKYLLEAFIRLKPRYPRLALKVAGPFEPAAARPYQNIIQAHRVTGVEFVGYVPPEDMAALYHQSDIFCAPSIGFESFGIVLLEAMAAGLPIVASNIAGYRAVITPQHNGLLALPQNPEALAAALNQLLDNPAQRLMMGRHGRATAGDYCWHKIFEKTLTVYHTTLEHKLTSTSRVLPYGISGKHLPHRQGKSC